MANNNKDGLSGNIPGTLIFGAPGKDGATFTPTVDDSGNLSWSNDGGLENPESKNIRGPQGATGQQGPQGEQGIQGETGEAGGYYRPTAELHSAGIMEITWTATKPSMTGLSPQYVNLPAGKSAYEYAVDGGYTGTEEEFAALMANPDSTQNAALTTEQINALVGMFKVCAFIKDDVSAEYTAFKTAFGITDSGGGEDSGGDDSDETEKTLSSVSATYSGGEVTAGTDVDDLTGIVVTAHYSDGTSEAVTGYTLSGTIAEGSNTITVSYGGMTAMFTVTGVAESGGGESDPNDTTVQIETYDVGLTNNGTTTISNGLGMSKLYTFESTTQFEKLKGICPYVNESVGSATGRLHMYADGEYVAALSFYGTNKPLNNANTEGYTQINMSTYPTVNGFKVPIAYAYVDDCYLYLESTGQVFFAGKNTPYYGLSNIAEATTSDS